MNRNYIIALILIVVGIATFMSVSEDTTTYADFGSAKGGERVKIIGKLSKDKPMEYNAEKNPNYFTFYMKDDKGVEKKVILTQPKPQDFEMSEEIRATGKMVGEDFEASELLLKCPSKYKNEEIAIKNKAK
jgi:cytochrome c-type biogenesis protein CcmE